MQTNFANHWTRQKKRFKNKIIVYFCKQMYKKIMKGFLKIRYFKTKKAI